MLNMDFIVFFWHLLNFFAPAAFLAVALGLGAWLLLSIHSGLRQQPRAAALASGADGLEDIRSLIAQAPARLAPGGWLLLEHGHDQADAVAALLRAAGWQAVAHRQDLAGHRRCTGARRPD